MVRAVYSKNGRERTRTGNNEPRTTSCSFGFLRRLLLVLTTVIVLLSVLGRFLFVGATTRTTQLEFRSVKHTTSQNKKLRLILHIGPPKTASTTLQQSLGELSQSLLQDGYVYLGKRRSKDLAHLQFQDKLLRTHCHSLMERFQQQQQNTTRLDYTRVPCWKEIVEEFQTVRKTYPNHHIVLSEEDFSQAPMLKTYETRPAFLAAFFALIDSSSNNNVDLEIVASYRHLEEQLWSAHKMQCLGQNNNNNEWANTPARLSAAIYGCATGPVARRLRYHVFDSSFGSGLGRMGEYQQQQQQVEESNHSN